MMFYGNFLKDIEWAYYIFLLMVSELSVHYFGPVMAQSTSRQEHWQRSCSPCGNQEAEIEEGTGVPRTWS